MYNLNLKLKTTSDHLINRSTSFRVSFSHTHQNTFCLYIFLAIFAANKSNQHRMPSSKSTLFLGNTLNGSTLPSSVTSSCRSLTRLPHPWKMHLQRCSINQTSTSTRSRHLNWCRNLERCCKVSNQTESSIFVLAIAVIVALLCFTSVAECVRVVSLNVPARVRKGSDLELSCLFDLGNATLYSLKWFYRAHEWDRDEQEFFRYTPNVKPYKQVFPLEGIAVDIDRSGGGTVYIREANGKTSGKYKCEISVDGTFQTVAAEKLMTVFNSNGFHKIVPKSNQVLLFLIFGFIWKYWYFY